MRKLLLACSVFMLVLSGCAVSVSNTYLDGKNLYEKGLVEESIKEFERVQSFFWLCKIYSETGEYDKAVNRCEQAVKLWRPVEYTGYSDINALFRDGLFTAGKHVWVNYLVDAYDNTGQTERASEVLAQYVEQDRPGDTNAFLKLSYLYNKQGEYDKSITAVTRAIALSPDSDVGYNNLAWAYWMKKQYAQAMRAFKKAIMLSPANAAYQASLGRLLYDKDDYAAANEAYKKAFELQPSQINYIVDIANTYRLMGSYDDAMIFANKAIETQSFGGIGVSLAIESGHPVVKNVWATGPAKKADVQTGDKIIQVDSNSIQGWSVEQVVQHIKGVPGTQVTLTVARKGHKKPLEKVATRKTVIDENAATSFGVRSAILRKMNKLEEALKDAEQAYLLKPTDGWAHFALGASHLDQGRYVESVKLLSQVKESRPARILEATAYAKQGDFAEAVEIYAAIPREKLFPKNVPLWSDRAALLEVLEPYIISKKKSARDLEAKGEYGSALAELGDVLKIAEGRSSEEICGLIAKIINIDPRLSELPEEARKYALRGDVLTEEGTFGEAVEEYQKAIQVAPYIAKLYFNTAMLYSELKGYPQAIRYMQTYLQLAPEAPNKRAAQDQIYKWEFKVEKSK